MKILYITRDGADADLQSLIQAQQGKDEVTQANLTEKNWEGLLDEIERADRVISWINTEHR